MVEKTKTCQQIGCSQAKYEKNCESKNCEHHPLFDKTFVGTNLCNHPKTWWACKNCGNVNCHSCAAFKLPTVDFCVNCYKAWLRRKQIQSVGDFKRAIKNFAEVGDNLIRLCLIEITKIEDMQKLREIWGESNG